MPTGTVTFLFTDIEGSTQRWAEGEEAMTSALAAHDELLRDVVAMHGGVVFKHTGDGVCAVFTSAAGAVTAAVDAQQRLELPVRVGVHTGEAELRDGDYFGPTLNRVARIMDAGHGGQILVSRATAALVPDLETTDLGEHRLKGLSSPEPILQIGTDEFPPLRVATARKGSLPTELTTFIGRTDEVEDLVDRMAEQRVVTLIGVGGTGKTRLAVEAAQHLGPTYPDGCWFAHLAPVATAEAVPFAVLAGLQVPAPPSGDVIEHLVRQLRHRRLLLILDNCEHVLDAAADAAAHIVAGCPAVTVLATSREPLMVSGEHLVPVPSLAGDDAVDLFVDRAMAEAPGAVREPEQLDAVRAICDRLDGVPLAIELAASRVRAFTPVELLGMLDERFSVLVGGRRSRVERHQTMRGALDWSYDLCTENERLLFDRLSVFPARFDLDAVREVTADGNRDATSVVDALVGLVDRSLVDRATGPDGSTRYGLLETMRAYGREHLLAGGELETVRGRHANFVVSRLQRMAEHLLGPDEDTVAARMAELLPDAVVAQEWLLDRQDWSGAEWCCWAGAYREERAFHEMHERLYHAMTSAGEEGRRYDRVAGNSRPQLETLDPEQVNELSWRWLRSEVTDDEQPHHTGAGAEPRTEDEVVELLRLAERRPEWPLVLRMYRRWCALRNIVRRGFSIPDGELERFEADADAADSADARVMAVEVRAQVAVAERRWRDAADWFERVIDGTAHRTTAIRTIATWARINCLAVAGDSPTSHELVDRWDEELATWGLPGSRSGVATAVALGAAGRRDLAERFVWWARDADPYALDVHRSWMELVGLGEPPIDSSPDAIDDLLDELRALADRSDVETARSAE